MWDPAGPPSAGVYEVIWRYVRFAGHGSLLLGPLPWPEDAVGNGSPESACAGIVVLKADGPGTLVPGQYLGG
jgi:hypothetical protein